MYNEDFVQEVIYKHGVENAILFCQIESDKYSKTIEDDLSTDSVYCMELQYERDWWADRAKRLKNNEIC